MARPKIVFRKTDNDVVRGSRGGVQTVADNPNRTWPTVNPSSSREALGSDYDQPDMRGARYAIDKAIPKIQQRKAQNAKLRSK